MSAQDFIREKQRAGLNAVLVLALAGFGLFLVVMA